LCVNIKAQERKKSGEEKKIHHPEYDNTSHIISFDSTLPIGPHGGRRFFVINKLLTHWCQYFLLIHQYFKLLNSHKDSLILQKFILQRWKCPLKLALDFFNSKINLVILLHTTKHGKKIPSWQGLARGIDIILLHN